MEHHSIETLSFEEVGSDAVLIHSHKQVDGDLAEHVARQESLIQLGKYLITSLREQCDTLRTENRQILDENNALRVAGTTIRDGKIYVTMDADHLNCPVCYSLLENPHVTPCGHIFCQHCLEQWFRRLRSLRRTRTVTTYTCPNCCAVVSSPPPPAYALRALLDSLPARECKPKVQKAWVGLFTEP